MNDTVLLRRVNLPESVPGALWLSAMPGRYAPLDAWLAAAQAAGVAHVAAVVGLPEIEARSPAYARALRDGGWPFSVDLHPIDDYAAPADAAGFSALVDRLASRVAGGEAVVIHCAAGIGRTGMTATRVLRALGLDEGDAADRVRRAGSSPETAAQRHVARDVPS